MHRLLLAALLALAFTACEKKPSEEEVAAAEEKAAEVEKAKASPAPKPGDWRIKDYKNPLDQTKGKK